MQELNRKIKWQYYASANTSEGFVSYFDRIFSQDRLDHLFILKGGPGSGKSSLIKRLSNILFQEGYRTELFYCSSDNNSLDGAIFKTENGAVGIIDGTAPHTRDPYAPGAKDEILYLGDGWDKKLLKQHTETIIDLNINKARQYKKAYENLYLSSIFKRKIWADINESFDFKKCAQDMCDLTGSIEDTDVSESEIRVLTSFSKDGYKSFNSFEVGAEETISVSNDSGEGLLVIAEILRQLSFKNIHIISAPSIVTKGNIDQILLPCHSLSFKASDNGEIESKRYLKDNTHLTPEEKDRYIRLSCEFEAYARLAFEKASDYHFMLEDIYKEAMDFALCDDLYEKTYNNIKSMIG